VQEAQVRLQLVVVGGLDRVGGPKEGEVVGEGGEEDAEEEADGCFGRVSVRGVLVLGFFFLLLFFSFLLLPVGGESRIYYVRPMMRKVAKELVPR
jgi:hypothetical protein